MSGSRHIVFLCSPSLGILDNWLPVLSALRERHPRWQFTAVVPLQKIVLKVTTDDTVIQMCDELFDRVVFQSQEGVWRRASGFVEACRDARGRRMARFTRAMAKRVAKRTRVAWPASSVHALARLLDRTSGRAHVNVTTIAGPNAIVCHDVYAAGKEACQQLLTSWPDVPRFSLHHGINVLEPRTPPHDQVEQKSTIAYLYSAREQDAYRSWFGIDPTRTRVVGVPRHEPAWMQHVIAASTRQHPDPPANSVLLISRPSGTPYLPHDRRRAALREIHRVVCEEHGLHLVVKLHPKERDRGDFDHVFPGGSEGRSWSRSRGHPFQLGATSLFAITFYSGVAMDMIALGVPTIERLDVRGIPGLDGPDTPRDDRGRPAFSYFSRHGLVLPADDMTDLRDHTRRILSDRDGVVSDLRTAYRAVFADPNGATSRIVDDITSC